MLEKWCVTYCLFQNNKNNLHKVETLLHSHKKQSCCLWVVSYEVYHDNGADNVEVDLEPESGD